MGRERVSGRLDKSRLISITAGRIMPRFPSSFCIALVSSAEEIAAQSGLGAEVCHSWSAYCSLGWSAYFEIAGLFQTF